MEYVCLLDKQCDFCKKPVDTTDAYVQLVEKVWHSKCWKMQQKINAAKGMSA